MAGLAARPDRPGVDGVAGDVVAPVHEVPLDRLGELEARPELLEAAVALSRETAIVGAPYENEAGSAAGAVYVYQRNGAGWLETAKLTADDALGIEVFGESVAISGSIAVVGAPGTGIDGEAPSSVYVFERLGETWTQSAKITPIDGIRADMFGSSVAISGERIVVGSPGEEDDIFHLSAGSAYVYKRIGTLWVPEAKLKAHDLAPIDEFGSAVAIDGDTIVVGAPLEDEGGEDSGALYVYRYYGSSWFEVTKLYAPDATEGEHLGSSVAIDGDTILAGAPEDDDACPGSFVCFSGSAYLFVHNGTAWTLEAKVTASDAGVVDSFGHSVALSADIALLGAYGNDEVGFSGGAAYLFRRSGGVWTEEEKLIGSDVGEWDQFGWSVAIHGSSVLVGATEDFFELPGPGSAYLFELDGISPPCTLDLALSYVDETLTLDLQIGAAEPVLWMAWLFAPPVVLPLWTLPLPAIDPPLSFQVPIPGFPHLGEIGVLTILTGDWGGILCMDWETVDTGS